MVNCHVISFTSAFNSREEGLGMRLVENFLQIAVSAKSTINNFSSNFFLQTIQDILVYVASLGFCRLNSNKGINKAYWISSKLQMGIGNFSGTTPELFFDGKQ